MTGEVHHGSCACGAVTLTVAGALPSPDACHCDACRKTTGHFLVSADVPRAALSIAGGEEVRWYAASTRVRRGFCGRCGATLFWDPMDRDWIGVAMGAFDGPTGTRIGIHVHVAEKGDYYPVPDDAPCFATVPPHPEAGGEAV